MTRTKLNDSGVVSMISVIFASILLMLTSLGLVRLSNDEQRSATDLMLSTRALYAADAGAQDAIFDIAVNGVGAPDVCNSSSSFDSDVAPGQSSYTCALLSSAALETSVGHNKTSTVNIASLPSGSTLHFNWFLVGEDYINGPVNLSSFSGSGNNPQCGTGSTNPNCPSPPIVKLELIGVPDSGSFTNDDIRRKTFVLRPSNTPSPAPTASFSAGGNMLDTASELNANCNSAAPGGTYMCRASVTSMSSSYLYTLVMTPLYQQRNIATGQAGTHVEISATSSSGSPVAVGTSIDVTARSSDIFRRVTYKVPLSNTSLLPSFSLLSDSTFCKNPFVDTSNGAAIGGTDNLTACR